MKTGFIGLGIMGTGVAESSVFHGGLHSFRAVSCVLFLQHRVVGI